MKKITFFLVLALLLSCDSDNESNDETNKVVLLKIDFLTNTFEGGKEFEFSLSSSFSISSTYQSPGDFGDIQLYYDELNEKIFDGTIHWMGLGEMTYPTEIDIPNTFSTIDDELALPNVNKFNTVMYDEFAYYPDTIKYENIWNSINNLEIVSSYRHSNPEGEIHLFLYTPSVGEGNPADWDWFIFMNN